MLARWHRIGYAAELGADNVPATKRIAIATIFDRLDRGICSSCTVRVFAKCKKLPLPVGPTGVAGPAAGTVPGSRMFIAARAL